MRNFTSATVIISLFAFSSPASAAKVVNATACASSDISPGASACQGWFSGNLNSGETNFKTADDSAAALNLLLGVSTFTGSSLTSLEKIDISSGNTINFGRALFGQTVFSVHVGAAKGSNGVGYESTAFYLFDAGNSIGGLDSFTFNRGGLSNARLFSTGTFVPPAVPEPSTWAFMLLGFGLIGFAMRSKMRQKVTVSYA